MANFFRRLLGQDEKRAESESVTPILDSVLLSIINSGSSADKTAAMGLPSVAAAVNMISSTAAGVKFKLYSYDSEGQLKEEQDARAEMFNGDTGDLLNGFEMKRAFVRDYILCGNGYIFKEQSLNTVTGLYYVNAEELSVTTNSDPIYKSARYLTGGKSYYPHQFITIARNSVDGVTGKGILTENGFIITLINNMLKMLNANACNGGVKRGILESENNLKKEQLDYLRAKFKEHFSNEGSTMLIVNKGFKYTDITESNAMTKLNELYKDISGDMANVLLVPESILKGEATDSEYRNWFKSCITPILNEICAALNESLLLESEKGKYFWRADTTEMINGDLKSMFEAYSTALDSNIMQLDEVRKNVGLPPTGFNYIKLGLDSVLVDVKKGTIYTPNTNAVQSIEEGFKDSTIDDKTGKGDGINGSDINS